MTALETGMLAVPGAMIYYKIHCGPGPVLLIIQGGAGDADSCDALARRLAARYRVVTYDRRGLSRSTEFLAPRLRGIDVHADDASRLLAAVAGEPAYLFGSSLGALIGVHLLKEHHRQVRLLVAHEAMVADLLPEADRSWLIQAQREIGETLRQVGVVAASRKLGAVTGAERPADIEPGLSAPSAALAAGSNLRCFLASDAPMASRYQFDAAALRGLASKVVPAAGVASRGRVPHRCAEALALLLSRQLAEFPGGHGGHLSQPAAFAAVLDCVLRADG